MMAQKSKPSRPKSFSMNANTPRTNPRAVYHLFPNLTYHNRKNHSTTKTITEKKTITVSRKTNGTTKKKNKKKKKKKKKSLNSKKKQKPHRHQSPCSPQLTEKLHLKHT